MGFNKGGNCYCYISRFVKLVVSLVLLLFIEGTGWAAASPDTLTIMSYNLLHFPEGQSGCTSHITDRYDSLRTIIDYKSPDVLMINELQHAAGGDSILKRALNAGERSYYKKVPFVPNLSGSDYLNNMFFYNSRVLNFHHQEQIVTRLRDVGKYVLFPRDTNLEIHHDTTFINFYLTHLKAGNSSEDEKTRAQTCRTIREKIDQEKSQRYRLLGGDFNFYTSDEPGYQILTNGGEYPFNDPVNKEGHWHNNDSFSKWHTQSTRRMRQMNCGATGGLDDRFDFLLISPNLEKEKSRIHYFPGSYKSLGNGGDQLNTSITTNNTTLPDSVQQALYYVSDHLPVMMQLKVQLPRVFTIDLTLIPAEQQVKLKWHSPHQNINAAAYVIEHSLSGGGFDSVGSVEIQENKNNYTFRHRQPVLGNNYYRVVAKDSTTLYHSKVARIHFQGEERRMELLRLHLNSADNLISVLYTNKEQPVIYELIDLQGQRHYKESFFLSRGRNRIHLPMHSLSPGVYILHIKAPRQQLTKRVMKF